MEYQSVSCITDESQHFFFFNVLVSSCFVACSSLFLCSLLFDLGQCNLSTYPKYAGPVFAHLPDTSNPSTDLACQIFLLPCAKEYSNVV